MHLIKATKLTLNYPHLCLHGASNIPTVNCNYAFILVLTFNSKNNSWKYLKFKVTSNIFTSRLYCKALKKREHSTVKGGLLAYKMVKFWRSGCSSTWVMGKSVLIQVTYQCKFSCNLIKGRMKNTMNANQTYNKILKILIRSFLKLSRDAYDAYFYHREKETHTLLPSMHADTSIFLHSPPTSPPSISLTPKPSTLQRSLPPILED